MNRFRRPPLLLVAVAVALIGAAAYFGLTARPAAATDVPDPRTGQHGPLLALGNHVVNLAPGGAFRYAKVGVTVELRPSNAGFYAVAPAARAEAEKTELASVGSRQALLLDAIGRVVASKRSDALLNTAGRVQLKTDLLAAMREAVGERAVLGIYLTDLVMQ